MYPILRKTRAKVGKISQKQCLSDKINYQIVNLLPIQLCIKLTLTYALNESGLTKKSVIAGLTRNDKSLFSTFWSAPNGWL